MVKPGMFKDDKNLTIVERISKMCKFLLEKKMVVYPVEKGMYNIIIYNKQTLVANQITKERLANLLTNRSLCNEFCEECDSGKRLVFFVSDDQEFVDLIYNYDNDSGEINVVMGDDLEDIVTRIFILLERESIELHEMMYIITSMMCRMMLASPAIDPSDFIKKISEETEKIIISLKENLLKGNSQNRKSN